MASLAFARGFPWPGEVSPPSRFTAFFNSITEFMAIHTPDALFGIIVGCASLTFLFIVARLVFFKATTSAQQKFFRDEYDRSSILWCICCPIYIICYFASEQSLAKLRKILSGLCWITVAFGAMPISEAKSSLIQNTKLHMSLTFTRLTSLRHFLKVLSAIVPTKVDA